MSNSISVSSMSRSSSSSRIGDKSSEPDKKGKSELSKQAKTLPKNLAGSLDQVQKVPSELDAETETVSSEDPSTSPSSHSDSFSELEPPPDPKNKHGSSQGSDVETSHLQDRDTKVDPTAQEDPDMVEIPMDLDKVTAVPWEKKALDEGAERYDPLRASWPGAVAYAGSFMAARLTQFALTTASNPQGAAMAFASVAGVLHLGLEPVVGALREKMGMRSDEDTANYTNYVTSLANYVHSWARGDAKGMQDAREVARKILASYNWNCDAPGSPMPDTWDEAVTMLKAGARGFASNEMPFFVFSVVYMLTNPAGLWVRTALLEATRNKDAAAAGELLMSVAGGLMAGIGTVGVQNAARTFWQATGDAPARRNIKLDRLNRSHLEFSQGSLQLLKKALKDSLGEEVAEATGPADIQAIEDSIAESLKESPDTTKARRSDLAVAIATQLEQLPRTERKRLLNEVKTRLSTAKQPYHMGQAIGEKYLQMVGTRDKDGVLHADTGKIRRTDTRVIFNVAGLLVYASALLHAMDTIAQYGPANEPPHVNASLPHDPAAFPTTPAQAYGEMASLGWSLIACWVGSRAVAPITELAISPITGLASRAGSAAWAAGARAWGAVGGYFAAAPVTNGAPAGATTPSGVDHV